jgi:signal transduction histidine kinase
VRRSDARVIAGVCEGIAQHLGVPALAVRAVFVVLTPFGGTGILAYAALWAFVPLQRTDSADRVEGQRRDRGQSVALLVVALGVVLLLAQFDVAGGTDVIVPLLIAGAGVALIWRRMDERRTPAGNRGWLLLLGGATLVLAGLIGFLVLAGQLGPARQAIVAILVIVVVLVLVTAPWWWRLATELTAERRERIRTQERAEVAAHLHDSVLQTLALIQRHVDSPREVARLARGQERELRSWLYGRQPDPAVRFAAAIQAAAAEVEDSYAVVIEAVVVGDCELDIDAAAVVQAAREALINAARHAGVEEVSLYAEVEPSRIAVYVRDRGVGFDTAAVPEDRHGLRGSIEGRMRRHGGTASVRSGAGSGTEVELTIDRSAA